MGALVVIPLDPFGNYSLRFFKGPEIMLPDAFFLETSEESLDNSILLRRVRRYELLRQIISVSYTHLRAHETVLDLVCRLLLEKKNKA